MLSISRVMESFKSQEGLVGRGLKTHPVWPVQGSHPEVGLLKVPSIESSLLHRDHLDNKATLGFHSAPLHFRLSFS